MFQTLKEEKAYMLNGDILRNSLNKQIGMLLLNERLSKQLSTHELSEKLMFRHIK